MNYMLRFCCLLFGLSTMACGQTNCCGQVSSNPWERIQIHHLVFRDENVSRVFGRLEKQVRDQSSLKHFKIATYVKDGQSRLMNFEITEMPLGAAIDNACDVYGLVAINTADGPLIFAKDYASKTDVAVLQGSAKEARSGKSLSGLELSLVFGDNKLNGQTVIDKNGEYICIFRVPGARRSLTADGYHHLGLRDDRPFSGLNGVYAVAPGYDGKTFEFSDKTFKPDAHLDIVLSRSQQDNGQK